MSLLKPHPLWTTYGSNPHEVNKAVIVAKLLSGRYRTDWLARHWTPKNKEGYCLLCPGLSLPGDIPHLLSTCQALQEKRLHLFNYWRSTTENNNHLFTLVNSVVDGDATSFIQFVLDPSVVPEIISGVQKEHFTLNEIFHLSRTYCYAMHRRRTQLLGTFNSN